MIPKKQVKDNEAFKSAWQGIGDLIPRERVDALVEQTVEEIKAFSMGKTVGYGWSGGKDSQALRGVMEAAGVNQCVLVRTDLEFPAFIQWMKENTPTGLQVINTGQDLPWLVKNLAMLFPRDAKLVAKWYRVVQHRGQERFFKEQGLDLLALGRRHADGNYTGKDGVYINARGITRWSPIRHWTHEEVLAFCHYQDMPLPPIYDWPRGWIVGTGPWAARTYTEDDEQGWSETYIIDPSVVEGAAEHIPSAREFLDNL